MAEHRHLEHGVIQRAELSVTTQTEDSAHRRVRVAHILGGASPARHLLFLTAGGIVAMEDGRIERVETRRVERLRRDELMIEADDAGALVAGDEDIIIRG